MYRRQLDTVFSLDADLNGGHGPTDVQVCVPACVFSSCVWHDWWPGSGRGGGVCPVNHSLDILFLSSRPRALCMTNETFGGGKKAETKVCIRRRDRTVLWWASRVFSYDYLISEERYERLCSQAQLFSYPSPTLINSISISSADMLHKLNTLKRCGKMTFLPLPGTLICADTLRCLFVGERWGGEAALPELWLKEKKKKRTERKAVADFQQADFIWFHQTLTADRPSRCRSLTGLPVDMYSTSRVSGGLTATSSPALFGLATTAASSEWIKITREAFDLI